MKYEIEMTEQDIKDLRAVRNYFGENDKTMFEHKAYAILDRLVKKLNTPLVSKCDGVEREALLNSFARFLEGYYSETGIKISDVSIDLFQQTI